MGAGHASQEDPVTDLVDCGMLGEPGGQVGFGVLNRHLGLFQVIYSEQVRGRRIPLERTVLQAV